VAKRRRPASPRHPRAARAEHRRLEAIYADGWYYAITGEMFG
jgi:hypothetical protein